ncbi:MAG: hypothetical protein VKN72_19335, partial [Nostocales cyanobacterium 94392]|nr:hypothetical protein [Nostocales cyanobacterium 94392]
FLGNTSAYAQNKRLMYEGFRQGTSWKVYLLNKKLAQEIKLGGETRRLYLVDLEINNSYSGIKRRTDLVQCSASAPFVAFKDDSIPQTAILHYINPGGEWAGYNQDSHLQYWVICHDLWKPLDSDLKRLAKQFGYSTQLESMQVEIPYGLMDKLK